MSLKALDNVCWILIFLCFGTIFHHILELNSVNLNTRSGAGAIGDDDNVELEKSNVLLMGPTGSGMISPYS